ncbi:hypothetical protein Pmani_033093 [Petrolisthes manimaculis]|uniref:Uncharacterized protein n=1 Tax=Petrolisthes manimaculis TaxID=1843537 RepID=A0AAE1NS78_9EUCA|nr:hypothetical protein Pmani_033093 [Petrolisthes manimaculis]
MIYKCICVSEASTACHIIYMNWMRDKENVHLHYASELDFSLTTLKIAASNVRGVFPLPVLGQCHCEADIIGLSQPSQSRTA